MNAGRNNFDRRNERQEKKRENSFFYSLFYTCPKKNETIIIESDLAFDRFFKCVDRREREKDKQSQLISIIYY